jgi:hypothetical protein
MAWCDSTYCDRTSTPAGGCSTRMRRAASRPSRVWVRFAETGEQRLTVAAIFSDKQSAGSSYLLGLPAYDANFTDRLDGRVLVKRAEGVSLGAARRRWSG